jgi:hypothetical protein
MSLEGVLQNVLIISFQLYGYAHHTLCAYVCTYTHHTLGNPHWNTMSRFNNRSPHSMAPLLPPTTHSHPPPRIASDMLASDTLYIAGPRTRETPRYRMGRHSNHDVHESERADLGDE